MTITIDNLIKVKKVFEDNKLDDRQLNTNEDKVLLDSNIDDFIKDLENE